MSKEQASEFLKKVSGDRAAAQKFREALRSSLVKAGKDAGFKFSREDLDAALAERKPEITEDELSAVAGGYVVATLPKPGELPPGMSS